MCLSPLHSASLASSHAPSPSFRPPSRNLIRVIRRRSRVKPGMSPFDLCLRRLSSRKATGRRTQFGNLGIVGYCLPPSHLGYSSILDSTRFGVGSSKLDSALAAPLIAFSDIVATRHSSSKLDSALAAPLIPATEPSSRPPSRDLHRIKHAADRGSSPR